jgi:hypothetical protein
VRDGNHGKEATGWMGDWPGRVFYVYYFPKINTPDQKFLKCNKTAI